jgi:hypothetical protein
MRVAMQYYLLDGMMQSRLSCVKIAGGQEDQMAMGLFGLPMKAILTI